MNIPELKEKLEELNKTMELFGKAVEEYEHEQGSSPEEPDAPEQENAQCTFTVTVSMRKRWKKTFVGMLKTMEYLGGDGGSSRDLIFFADGNGDFRPEFEFSRSPDEMNEDDILMQSKMTGEEYNALVKTAGSVNKEIYGEGITFDAG